MNLGQFHTMVSNAIKRGTSLDAFIPLWTSQAARLLEQNYSFSWMARTVSAVLPQTNSVLEYSLPALVKNVEFVKPLMAQNSDGTEWYGDSLVGVSSDMITGISGGNPQGYYVEGSDGGYKLIFDAIGSPEGFKIRLRQNVYTDWPVDLSATPALLLRGEMALFAQTLVLFANGQRDPRMVDQYGGILQGALNTLLRSEEEFKLAHQNDLKMGYSGLE